MKVRDTLILKNEKRDGVGDFVQYESRTVSMFKLHNLLSTKQTHTLKFN